VPEIGSLSGCRSARHVLLAAPRLTVRKGAANPKEAPKTTNADDQPSRKGLFSQAPSA